MASSPARASIPSATAAAALHFAAAAVELAEPMEIPALPSPDAPQDISDFDGMELVTGALEAVYAPPLSGSTPQARYEACVAAGGVLDVAEAIATRGALLFRLGIPNVPDLVAVSLGDGRVVEGRGRRHAITRWAANRGVVRVSGRPVRFAASRLPLARTYNAGGLVPSLGYLRPSRQVGVLG